jgi:Kef-type K+ transport system membrane component KefB
LLGPTDGQLFLELAVIIAASYGTAQVLRWLQQPPVVGQMVAGIILGPSVFGLLAIHWQTWLLPHATMPVLKQLGAIGLVFYMFAVGLRVDHGFLRRHVRGATSVSITGVVLPLVVGGYIGAKVVTDSRLVPASIDPFTAILFVAAAMSVTAFPVMARIIEERGLRDTAAANIALSAGSVADVVAWGLLAVVLSRVSGSIGHAATTIAGAVIFVAVCWLVLRPILRWATALRVTTIDGAWPVMITLVTLLAAAAFTDLIGIHPAFGAFVLGLVAPRDGVIAKLADRLAQFAVPILLPVYFVYTGLNTQIGLINSTDVLLVTALIVVAAVASKGIGCWLAARLAGLGMRDAASIGTLMNARGLVELILLNVGLERGLITPTLFSIMVVMAVVTTVTTSPLLLLLNRSRQERDIKTTSAQVKAELTA